MLPFLPSRLLQDLDKTEWKVNSEAYCNCCNNYGGITFVHKLFSDFDTSKHSKQSWIEKFKWAEDGVCMSCGHFQRYSRFNEKELAEYLRIFSDKSKTSQGVISTSATSKGEDSRIRIMKIMKEKYINKENLKTIYMARPTSVKAIDQAKKIFNAERIDFKENNEKIRTKILEQYGHHEWLNSKDKCEVHGQTNFPENYDLSVITHCLQHSIDLKKDLDCLEQQVKMGNLVLLLDEVQRKIHNPFHVNHMSEVFITRELNNRGLNTILIQDMTTVADETIRGLQSTNKYTGILVRG